MLITGILSLYGIPVYNLIRGQLSSVLLKIILRIIICIAKLWLFIETQPVIFCSVYMWKYVQKKR